ncbi:MAG: divergent polysaccharide deacetylase family protein [Pseudomonadota bacterium]
MGNGKSGDPAPFRSGLLHGFLSVVSFAGIAAFAGAAVHITGDPGEAGPSVVVSLFDADDGRPANLKNRFTSPTLLAATITEGPRNEGEPNLGVADPNTVQAAADTATAPNAQPRGIRINGKTVLPGQSLSDVEKSGSDQSANTGQIAGQITTISATPPEEETTPTNPNVRPFDNPEGKPIVALVIGGLGTSYRQSQIAIDDLPEEVTLSFVPDASSDLLRKARRQGHEILAELPMEAHSTGRTRPHQNTLTVTATKDENAYRLRATLRNKPGIYGVISYDGSKFVSSGHAVSAVASDLAQRDLAFIQHANLNRTIFETHADSLDMDYAAATVNIDSRPESGEIERALLALESTALETGAALGTGFAFPMTVDVVRDWATHLEDKGIKLAPVSAVAAARQGLIQTTQLTEPGQPAQN